MELVDTHCHIHEAGPLDEKLFVQNKWGEAGFIEPELLISVAVEAGVTRLICVGCTLLDSQKAIQLASNSEYCYASIGIHPHEAKDHLEAEVQAEFAKLASEPKVLAIGECGLDYYYNHSAKEDQIKLLRLQLELAQKHSLPVIFHVREAFDDFWPIFDEYQGIRGVIHSFTANREVLKQVLARGLYVGLNGIITFTKKFEQLETVEAVPLNRILLETDAPFLTPAPYRGTICQPKHVKTTAEFLAQLRSETLDVVAIATTQNARQLFNF